MPTGLRTADLGAVGARRSRELGAEWVSIEHGLHVPATLADSPDGVLIGTALGATGEHHIVGGWAALALQGVPYFSAAEYGSRVLMHCLPGGRLRHRRSIMPFEGLLHPDEIADFGDWRCTTIARAAFDQMRMARSLEEAVVVADTAASRIAMGGRTSLESIARVVASHHKVRGIVRAREALTLASERSASPWETRLRMRAVRDVGLTVKVNVPVFDLHGNLLGIADLIDDEAGVVLESDGSQHREITQHRDDNEREELFENVGLAVARFMAADHRDRWKVVGRIEAARWRARGHRRAWTLDPPPWWFSWKPGARYR